MKTKIIALIIFLVCLILTFLILWFNNSDKKDDNDDDNDSPYKILHDWKGVDLKPDNNKGWEYVIVSDAALTNGIVDYGKNPELLTENNDGSLRIDLGPPVTQGNRKSIRLTTNDTYNEGLFIINASHIPEGLGTWPAFWLTGLVPEGSAWACYGEIDIIEGVNSTDSGSSYNKMSLHTNTPSNGKVCDQTGVNGIDYTNCDAGDGNSGSACGCSGKEACPNLGCGIMSKKDNTFGYGFNQNGGGVYACELTSSGKITIWFFENKEIPSDITSNSPNPDNWSKDNIEVAFNECPGQFQQLQIILNTTLCGQWAGAVYPGGTTACETYARTQDYDSAYWTVNYVKVFKKK